MKVRTSIIAAGAAVVLGTTGALVLPAVASAHSSTHTLKFTSVEKDSITFTANTTFGQQDTDINSAGKKIGYDLLYVKGTSATSAAVNITGDFSGGFLYGTATINPKTGAFSNGKVTGGTGSIKGATGTITVKPISNVKTAVTVTYSV